LSKIGFVEPSEIQRAMIPVVLQGRDVLGQARTGTGKTAAFGLPVLQMLERDKKLQSLILAPTRELAVQVAAELRRLSPDPEVRIVPVYGGQKIRHQLHLLGKKPHMVVGTPGRVIDLMERRALQFDNIRFVVLDEVDRMLDIGFRDDIRKILSNIKTEHQTVFVSATINDEIGKLSRQFTHDAQEVNVSHDVLTVEEVEQLYVTVDPWDKRRLLLRVLEQEDPRLAIVFCNTKHGVRRLAKGLHGAGVDAREIHGDLVQQKRERIMDRFRKHKLQVLVATDLAARGIDVTGISHIINYDIPEDPSVYVHRIGRTARMGTFGKAISFVTREEGKQLTAVEMLINKQIPQYQVDNFEPSPPPRESRPTQEQPLEKPVEEVEPPTQEQRKKSIGGKHKPARRRRL
jgi:ATP-dependent RNA helicase DeaD